MSLYFRYFTYETLVQSVDELIDYLKEINIPDLYINEPFVRELREYADGPTAFPKRYKVHQRAYFIVIKNTAKTLEEFKANNKKTQAALDEIGDRAKQTSLPSHLSTSLLNKKIGWYEGRILFKRVTPIPGTSKFQYNDTDFIAHVLAESGMHCYERIVQHLKNRQDVDPRSQFPSARGRNFTCTFLGETRNEDGTYTSNEENNTDYEEENIEINEDVEIAEQD